MLSSNIKNFLVKFFLLVDDGFNHYETISNVSYFKKLNFSFNRYSILFNLRYLIIILIQILVFPISILLLLTNTKIISANPFTIGNCIEELESLIKRNALRKKKINLVFFAPKNFCHNNTIPKLFKKKLFIIENIFLAPIIIALTHYKYCLENAVIKTNKSCIFPVQYSKNKIINETVKQNICSHNIIFEDLLNFEKRKLNVNFDNFFQESKLKSIKKKYLINQKFCVLHIREEKNHLTRNSNFANYELAIKFLIKKNFKIIILTKKKIYNSKNIFYLDPNDTQTHIDQFYLIKFCDLYLGTLSGPWALANLFKKDIILTSTVVFNFPIINKNYINLPKRFFLGKKQLKIKDIFELGLECSWNYKDYKSKNIHIKDNTPKEILKTVKYYFNKNKKFLKFNSNFLKKEKFKNYLIINRIPDWY